MYNNGKLLDLFLTLYVLTDLNEQVQQNSYEIFIFKYLATVMSYLGSIVPIHVVSGNVWY